MHVCLAVTETSTIAKSGHETWQGFPRGDIDVSAVRADRQQMAGAAAVHGSAQNACPAKAYIHLPCSADQ